MVRLRQDPALYFGPRRYLHAQNLTARAGVKTLVS